MTLTQTPLIQVPAPTPPQAIRTFEGVAADLESKAARLKTVIARLREESDDEFAARGADRHQVERLIDMCQTELRDIGDALERTRRGTYGSCETCGRAIPPDRLEALPQSRTCLHCADAQPRLASPSLCRPARFHPTGRSRTMPTQQPTRTPTTRWQPDGGPR